MDAPPILFLAHRIPYPPNKGDKVRSHHFLRHLSARHRVFLGTFVDDPEDWAHEPELARWSTERCVLPLNPLSARLRSVMGLISGAPLTNPYYASRTLRGWVEDVIERERIQTAFVFSSSMAQYVMGATRLSRRVVDFVDLDSDKWRQYAERQRPPMRWVYQREHRRLAQWERQVAAECRISTFVSAAEAALFCAGAPDPGAVHPLGNGVDLEYFDPSTEFRSPYATTAPVLVFTGAMDYWPNVDAVVWFCEQVMPLLRARQPGLEFWIVGANPTAAVEELADRPGVRVTGRVEDVRPYLRHADLAVAPLRIARGIQNKVLEAMAMGTPLVASRAAFEGMQLQPWMAPMCAATEPQEYAERVVALLGSDARGALVTEGRRWVGEHHSWQRNCSALEALLMDVEA
ncbi:MAG: TIGR03087 family PEP-CTERM/XrtA system glycosyltransferase [Pseudomonadota bacterium]|nr:TIGR03087 family PEP-CTERM/XrtA system glycosyltransferase [Pseudomonadota bacterium]